MGFYKGIWTYPNLGVTSQKRPCRKHENTSSSTVDNTSSTSRNTSSGKNTSSSKVENEQAVLIRPDGAQVGGGGGEGGEGGESWPRLLTSVQGTNQRNKYTYLPHQTSLFFGGVLEGSWVNTAPTESFKITVARVHQSFLLGKYLFVQNTVRLVSTTKNDPAEGEPPRQYKYRNNLLISQLSCKLTQ